MLAGNRLTSEVERNRSEQLPTDRQLSVPAREASVKTFNKTYSIGRQQDVQEYLPRGPWIHNWETCWIQSRQQMTSLNKHPKEVAAVSPAPGLDLLHPCYPDPRPSANYSCPPGRELLRNTYLLPGRTVITLLATLRSETFNDNGLQCIAHKPRRYRRPLGFIKRHDRWESLSLHNCQILQWGKSRKLRNWGLIKHMLFSCQKSRVSMNLPS